MRVGANRRERKMAMTDKPICDTFNVLVWRRYGSDPLFCQSGYRTALPPRKSESFQVVRADSFSQASDARRRNERGRPENAARQQKLKGDREGQWSIRLNDQWRICFRFDNGDALEADIVDYH